MRVRNNKNKENKNNKKNSELFISPFPPFFPPPGYLYPKQPICPTQPIYPFPPNYKMPYMPNPNDKYKPNLSPRQPIQPPRQPMQPPRQPMQPPRQPMQPPQQPMQPPRPVRNSLDFLNGWLRTQVGKYMRIDFIVSNQLVDKAGRLLEVGFDYVLLQDILVDKQYTGEFSSIKFVRVLEPSNS